MIGFIAIFLIFFFIYPAMFPPQVRNVRPAYAGLSQKKSQLLNRSDAIRLAREEYTLNHQASKFVCGPEGHIEMYVTESGHFPICVHSKEDLISDRIRQYGVWDDCEELVWFVWNEFQGGPGRGPVKQSRLNIIDVGANIGSCSIRLALLGHRVFSFEPVDTNYLLFERSVQLNNLSNSLTLIKAGASDHDGEATVVIEEGNRGNAVLLNQSRLCSKAIREIEVLVRSVPNSSFACASSVALQPSC